MFLFNLHRHILSCFGFEESSSRPMENQYEKKITWTIKNFPSLGSEKVYSDQFVVGDSKWRLLAYPKGGGVDINKCLSLYLDVADSESLPCGWKRHTKFRLTVVNQISEKLSQQNESQNWFDHKSYGLGYSAMIPLTKLHDKNGGFLVNGEVKIVAEVSVLEVVCKSDVLKETLLANESIHVNGFQVLSSQVESVNSLFQEHPDFASKFHTKNPLIRTTYLNVILSLTEILSQSPEELSSDDLTKACSTLSDVTKVGFELDWLKKKLKEVCKTQIEEVEKELKKKKQKCAEIDELLKFLR